MKEILLDILNKYLFIFPEEQERQQQLLDFLKEYNSKEITDWNNFNGHIVASWFIYAKEEAKFLVLYHKDLKMFLYPGGHIDFYDKTPLDASKREVKEETGLDDLKVLKVTNDELVPIDIDTHIIDYNEKLNLPFHYHFDFRYLFMVDRVSKINVDIKELSNFKWISIDELSNDLNYGEISKKVEKII